MAKVKEFCRCSIIKLTNQLIFSQISRFLVKWEIIVEGSDLIELKFLKEGQGFP